MIAGARPWLARHRAIATLLLALAAIYFPFTWSGELADGGGDLPCYIFAARWLAPYLPPDPIGAEVAAQSQFPPLYPFVLMVTGGAVDLHAAHAATTVCLLGAFVAFYAWLLTLGLSRILATAAVAIFAIAPATYKQSLVLYADSLYLLLSLAFLVVLARAGEAPSPRRFWLAAALLACAMLARTVGMALVPAFALVLWLKRPPRWPAMLALSVLPSVLWAIFHRTERSYSHALLQDLTSQSVESVVDALLVRVGFQARGLLQVLLDTPTLALVLTALWAVAAIVAARRLWRGAPDVVYMIVYLGIVTIWPYPAQAIRFAWMVLPLLLGYVLVAAASVPAAALRKMLPATAVVVLALMTAPNFALAVQRWAAAADEPDPRVRYRTEWYDGELAVAREYARASLAREQAVLELTGQVPEDECVFAIKPYLVTFATHRRAYGLPPWPADDATFGAWLEAKGCRYVLMLPYEGMGYSAFYPMDRMRDRLEVLAMKTVEYNGMSGAIAILATRQ
jgi:hypothetical protein